MFTIRYCLSLVLALTSLDVVAGVIVNGDFSNAVALNGFTSSGSVSEPSPGDFAQFETSGVLKQGFDIPFGTSTLSFDFAFSTTALSGTFSGFDDSFAAELTTSPDADVLDIFVVDVSGVRKDPLNGFEPFFPGLVPIDVNYDPSISIPGFLEKPGGTDFSGRISLSLPSEVLGESATITFRLLNNDSGFDSIAAIDNLAVTTTVATIPEPTTLTIWLCFTAPNLLFLRRKRQHPFSTLGDVARHPRFL